MSQTANKSMRLACLRWVVPLAFAAAGLGCGPGDQPLPRNGAPAQTLAESFKDFGEYVVHFNAISTDQLTPDVARVYDIERSKNRAMLNIAIIRKVEGTLGESVPGRVEARASNLTGQLKTVEVRRIDEGEAIYYIAEMPVANGETLIFDVRITPESATTRYSFRFQKTFYTT